MKRATSCYLCQEFMQLKRKFPSMWKNNLFTAMQKTRARREEKTGQYLLNRASGKDDLNSGISDTRRGIFKEVLHDRRTDCNFCKPQIHITNVLNMRDCSPENAWWIFVLLQIRLRVGQRYQICQIILNKHSGVGNVPQILKRGESVEASTF